MRLAEFRTSVNLTGFHVFALMQVSAQIFYFHTDGDAFSQKIERSLSIFPIALCYTPVAAMCFLPNFAPWRIWQAFMCSHLCTYSHQIFFFRTDGDAFSQKIERSVSIFFSDSFVVYSCSCHVLLAETPLSELILRFVISCYISHDVSLCVPYF